MMIEIPEELKAVGEAVEALVRQIETAWRSTRGGQEVLSSYGGAYDPHVE
jgi:hypothetical protein